MKRWRKRLTKKQIEEKKLTDACRFQSGGKSTFWTPKKEYGSDYKPPIPDGELARKGR
jgi:hypothetical protein